MDDLTVMFEEQGTHLPAQKDCWGQRRLRFGHLQRILALHPRVVAMSFSVDDRGSHDAEIPTATLPEASETPHKAGNHSHEHHHHHILIEPEEDRWRWRRKIREDKRKLAVYRVAVGLVGLILVALGFVSGPIPGPGGIPLILLGLAVWSSEFEWAHQLMMWFKKELHRYRTWSRAKQVLFWVVFLACCGIIGYLYLLLTGPPTWLPGSVDVLLQRLPGL
jgi:uncharacterized protein (TIGR02611 family)